MPIITLPDGSQRPYDRPVSGAEIARDIGPGLAKAALVLRLDGKLVDLATVIDRDAQVAIVTSKSPEALEVLRHDVAHLMAEAVKELYPETQVTIGPAIENGFYYDFARAHPFTPDDLTRIEARMHEIVARDETITREEWQRDDAVKFFADQGEKYKAEIIERIPATEPIGLYRQGDFIDLCRGPHLPSTGKVGKAFKLMKVAGAYWRGDSKNEMLQRIYGTAWFDEKDLKAHLTQIEEAEKRDHRRIGKEMDLFHLQDDAAGSIFWHPHGWTLYRLLENFIRVRLDRAGYVEVRTPQLVDKSLFVASGHWDMYGDNMYKVAFDEGTRMFGVKPMNCPCHVQIFNQGLKSYRDLPIRMAEFGSCHRNEPSGALHGIMRVRAFTQDDAHIFCTPDQITDESIAFCKLTMDAYRDLGFNRRRDQAGHTTRQTPRDRRDLGSRRGRPGRCGQRRRTRSRGSPGRRRLLWSEAGVPSARHDRPAVAVRHPAARLQLARTARRQLCGRGRPEASARHAATGPCWARSSGSSAS